MPIGHHSSSAGIVTVSSLTLSSNGSMGEENRNDDAEDMLARFVEDVADLIRCVSGRLSKELELELELECHDADAVTGE